MKKLVCVLFILILMTCFAGCENGSRVDADEPPRIVFLVRTELYDIVEKDIVRNLRLGFYDSDGNFYVSTDSNLNEMDNKTLIEEYEAGHLTEQVTLMANCDADKPLEQYKRIRNCCLEDRIEMVDFNGEIPMNPMQSSST